VASVQRYERYPEDRGDILGVGHAITASKDIDHSADEFLDQLNREESDQFRVMTDF
jgi:bifunctional enzyme Fae/Hps